jgi:hypothetical protein
MKRLAHKDIVDETMAHLDSKIPVSTFKLKTTLGTSAKRNWFTKWALLPIISIFVSDPCLQAFEMCHAGDFNLWHVNICANAFRPSHLAHHKPYALPGNHQQQDERDNYSQWRPFSNEIEANNDGSNIPIDIIWLFNMSDGSVSIEGFGTGEGYWELQRTSKVTQRKTKQMW